jgi:hypothetical protein
MGKALAFMVLISVLTSSQGPLTSTSEVNNGTGISWVNMTNIRASDDSRSDTGNLITPSASKILQCTGYGFSIPSTASIVGVKVTIEREKTGSGTIKDSTVKLVVAGSGAGNDKADTSTAWPSSDDTVVYGSSSDTWGNSLTVSQVNASDFGVQIKVQCMSGTADPQIDYVAITVYYNNPRRIFVISRAASSVETLENLAHRAPSPGRLEIGWLFSFKSLF